MKHQLTVGDALTRLPGPKGDRYELFSQGTLSVELGHITEELAADERR